MHQVRSTEEGAWNWKEDDFRLILYIDFLTDHMSSAMLWEFELELGGWEVGGAGGVVGNKPGTV